MKVLIVDDDKLARKGLMAIMNWEKYGFEVAGDVQNGRKAMEFLREHPVDIVFTDIDMPELDGIELMQKCREEYPEVKFVIFSVYEDFRYAQTAIRLGALDYISKISFDPEECEQILEQISAKYREICGKPAQQAEDRDRVRELEERWLHPKWIFDDREFSDLCRAAEGVSFRSAERIFVRSFHRMQDLSGGGKEFPSLDSVGQMLDWTAAWRDGVYRSAGEGRKSGDISSFAAVVLYVKGHLGEDLRLETAAELIGMSRSHFSARFKEMTGETFHHFVVREKMRAAGERIREGEKSITQIATELGYDNFHYFARNFAREYGCTPADYRKQVKNV